MLYNNGDVEGIFIELLTYMYATYHYSMHFGVLHVYVIMTFAEMENDKI